MFAYALKKLVLRHREADKDAVITNPRFEFQKDGCARLLQKKSN